MVVGATMSLFSLELEALVRDWLELPLGQLVAGRPRGRAASAMAHPALKAADRSLPAARAGLPPDEARALFDALVEDRARAHVHDAPYAALAELFASLSRASVDAAPSAYPADLRPRDPAGGLVVWPPDPVRLARAATTVLALPAPRSVDPALWADLTEAVAHLLSTTGPTMVIVAESA